MPRNPDFPHARDAIALSEFVNVLWARKWRLLIVALAAFATGFAICSLVTPRYKTETDLLIEGAQNNFTRSESQRLTEDSQAADIAGGFSQLELLLSREVAQRVIAREKLAEQSEFTRPTWRNWVPALLSGRGSLNEYDQILAAYYRRLTVRGVEGTRVVELTFWSEDPVLAARIANAIVDSYFELRRKDWQQKAAQASEWLNKEIEKLRESIAQADAKLNEYRDASGLVATTELSSLESQQLNELTAGLSRARSVKAAVDAQLQRLNELLAMNRVTEASTVANSASMQSLARRRELLTTQLAQSNSTLMASHPRNRQIRAQIGEIESEMEAEARRIVRSLENQSAVAQERVRTIEAALDEARERSRVAGTSTPKLRELDRESRMQRRVLEKLLLQQGEATMQKSLEVSAADVRQISRAGQPQIPYFPRKGPIAMLFVASALMMDVVFLLIGQFRQPGPQRAVEAKRGAVRRPSRKMARA